jgi:RNA recognition motif-containing protein
LQPGEIELTNIFVGNLSFDTTDSDLHAAFGAYGSVERASVVRDRDSGQSRGFGFVEMTNTAEATQAMTALNGQDLNGRTLNVNEARPREANGGRQGGYNRNNSGGNGRRRESRW